MLARAHRAANISGASGSRSASPTSCATCRIGSKILGEELVGRSRDQSGAVGLLELHCPHRGTSLEFGLIDAKGNTLLLSTDGCSLRTGRSSRPPGEPAESTLKDRLYHGGLSYPRA